ncbi:MAG: LamG domain-containing protein [Anaerohalosphaeraceae bacterium]
MKKLCVVFVGMLAIVSLTQAGLVGLWEFTNASDLTAATIGNDMVLSGSHTAVTGISAGDGAARIGSNSYYKVAHEIGANGGGIYTNKWTLVYDIKCPLTSGYSSLLQTNKTNTNDGELFTKSNGEIGLAATQYAPAGTVAANTWFRLVVRVDNGSLYELWINGVRVLSGTPQSVDGRHSLEDIFLLFADEDGEEENVDVTRVALYDETLSEAAIQALGGVTTPISGFMAVNVSPVSKAKGILPDALLQWKAPRDPNNAMAADPDTHSFVVYCDPNLARLKEATYEHHTGVPYFADQLLVGNIAADPIQSYTPTSLLAINTTYYWRVDTRTNSATEPNDVIVGNIWSFNTNQKPENVVAHSDIVKPGETNGKIVVTTDNPSSLQLFYQWYLDVDPSNTGDEVLLSEGAEYAGVNTNTLTVIDPAVGAPAIDGDEGFYICDVTSSGGTVRSNSARLVIGRLVNHFEFDGNLTDSAGGYDAELIAAGQNPTWPAGQIGTNAMELYGDKGAIFDLTKFALNPYPTTGQEFTLTAWVYVDTPHPTWASIIKHWNGGVSRGMFHFGLDSGSGALDLQIDQANETGISITDSVALPTGQWQFVAAVADGAYIHLYRMGADEAISSRTFEVASHTYDGTLNTTSTKWVGIGCKPAAQGSGNDPGADPGAAGFWDGKLDDLRVYNYGLNAEQIADIFGSSVCIYSKNPAPSWVSMDFNKDCKVSLDDFAVFAAEWLQGGIYHP